MRRFLLQRIESEKPENVNAGFNECLTVGMVHLFHRTRKNREPIVGTVRALDGSISTLQTPTLTTKINRLIAHVDKHKRKLTMIKDDPGLDDSRIETYLNSPFCDTLPNPPSTAKSNGRATKRKRGHTGECLHVLP